MQFIDVIASFMMIVTAQWEAEVVILFAVALNDPPANVWAFLATCAGQDRRRVCSAPTIKAWIWKWIATVPIHLVALAGRIMR